MQWDTLTDLREKKNTSIAGNVTKCRILHKSLLTRRLSHCLILPKKFSVRRAKVILGRLKQNSCWQHLTISIWFVLNSFMKNLLMTKSIEAICDLFNGRAQVHIGEQEYIWLSYKTLLDRRVSSTFQRWSLGYCTYASSVFRDKQTPPRHASVNLVYDRKSRRYAEDNNRT